MVVVTAAAVSAGTNRRSNVHLHAPREHDGRGFRRHPSDTDELGQKLPHLGSEVYLSESSVNSMRPGLHQFVTRSSSRWFLDVLSQRLSESHRKPVIPRHWLVDSTWFNAVVSVIVVANTLQIGLSVDITHGPWLSLWYIVDIVFAFLFGLEMVIKVVARRREYFNDKWNLLDFLLAWMAIIEVIFVAVSTSNSGIGKLTVLRMLRLVRLLRMLRLFQIFKELVILIQVMVESLKTLAWLLVLVCLLLYVTAILCVELVGSNSSYPSYNSDMTDLSLASGFNNFQYFGTIIRSMFSLFSLITLSEWSTITRPIAEHQPGVLIILTIFAMLTAYGVMNVLVGVMVEQALRANADFAALVSAEHKQDQMEIIKRLASMLSDHAEAATGNADITPQSLMDAINSNTSLADMLTHIDLPSNCSVRELFTLIDDNGDGRISQDEFEATMYRMLFCGEFQRSCILQTSMNTIKRMLTRIEETLETICNKDGIHCSLASSWQQVQKEDGNRCMHASMQEHNSSGEITTPVAFADEFVKLRMELQEMRFEFGARLAEVGPRWRPPQATKMRTAPAIPEIGLAPETLSMGSGEINTTEADVNDSAMPALVPGLPLRPVPGIAGTAHASEAASLLCQLDDLVDGLEQHCSEPELATRFADTATDTDGHALVRLRCAHLIARLAQALAGTRNTKTGSSNVSRSLEERKDRRGMPPNTWDVPEGGPPLQSVWAMKACCGDNRRFQPVKKL